MRIYNDKEWKVIREKGNLKFTLKGFYFAFYLSFFIIIFDILIDKDELDRNFISKYIFHLIIQSIIWCGLYRFYYWNKNENRFLSNK